MKRRALKLIVFLLAGAIINVAVAWGCWELRPARTMGRPYDEIGVSNLTYGVWVVGSPMRAFHWDYEREFADGILWPGFAINTIFYAAIVWMLFVVPGAVRRKLRHKRGQCASCGYSLRGTPDSEKCPECGATA